MKVLLRKYASVAKPRFLAPERHLHYSFSLKKNSRYGPS